MREHKKTKMKEAKKEVHKFSNFFHIFTPPVLCFPPFTFLFYFIICFCSSVTGTRLLQYAKNKRKEIQSIAESRKICIEIRYLTIEISGGIKSNIAASSSYPIQFLALHFFSLHTSLFPFLLKARGSELRN